MGVVVEHQHGRGFGEDAARFLTPHLADVAAQVHKFEVVCDYLTFVDGRLAISAVVELQLKSELGDLLAGFSPADGDIKFFADVLGSHHSM